MLLGFFLWNLGNYAFFLLAGRILGPEDYGLVAALLAVVLVIQTPFMSFAGALARVVGGRADRGAGVYALALRRAVVVSLAAGAVAALVIVVAGALDDRVFDGRAARDPRRAAARRRPAARAGPAPGPAGLPALRDRDGRIRSAAAGGPRDPRGPRARRLRGASGHGDHGVHRRGGRGGLHPGAGPGGARRPGGEAWRHFSRSLPPFFVGIAALAALTNVDVMAAKLALTGHEAGIFASAAVIAKSVLVIPQVIATVAVPRIAARRSAGRSTDVVLVGEVAVGIAASLAVIAGAALLSGPVVRLTFGDEFADASGLLAGFTLAMSLMGIVIVLLYHQLSLGSYAFAWVLAGAAVLQAVLLSALHGSAEQIVAVDAAVALLAIAVHEVMPGRSGDRMWRGVAAMMAHGAPSAGRR